MNALLAYAEENSGGSSTISLVLSVAGIAGLWMMLQKANQPGWAAIIPFYNWYKLCEVVMGDPWYWLRLFIPFYNIYVYYVIAQATARAYGKPDSWTWGYFFLRNIFHCITGFDNSTYYGPMGSGDARTGEARAAKTVDFDVTKNEAPVEPVVTAAPAEPAAPTETVINAAPAAAPAEPEDVEFEFDPSNDASE